MNLELRKFVAPEFLFGIGSIDLAGRYASHYGIQHALLVSDEGVAAAGWMDRVRLSLVDAGIRVTIFTAVTPNPRDDEVEAGVEIYHSSGCNGIVAVGGGSVIDCAKGIGVVTSNRLPIQAFEGVDKVVYPMPPLVCIPTTSGTSADISQFAIIRDVKRRVKFAIVSKSVVPDVALIDPQTLATMSPELTVATGLDALVHAFEAYVSNASSPITDVHALEAVRLIAHYLPRVVQPGRNTEDLGGMMLASLQAGLAFSNASLGAVHAMAHAVGGFLDSPHGECNAALLASVVAFNFPVAEERYMRLGRTLGLFLPSGSMEEEAEGLISGIRGFVDRVGFDGRLSDMGILPEYIPELAQLAMHDACMVTNPRRPTVENIEAIYGQAL